MMCLSRIVKSQTVVVEHPAELKSREKKAPAPEAGPSPPADWNARAETVINVAVRKAEEIIQKANERVQELFEDAKRCGMEEGLVAGFEQGVRDGKQQVMEFENSGIEELKALLSRLEQEYAAVIEQERSEEIPFAFSLASKIIGIEINRNDEAFLKLYENAASHIGETTKAVLKVGPRGFEIATKNKKQLMKCIAGLEQLEIEIIGDDNGSCILETPEGSVDASAATQFHKAQALVGGEAS